MTHYPEDDTVANLALCAIIAIVVWFLFDGSIPA